MRFTWWLARGPLLSLTAFALVWLVAPTHCMAAQAFVALIDNRLEAPGRFVGRLVGHELDSTADYRLRHRASGEEIALSANPTASQDTLAVTADLSDARLGLYDLAVRAGGAAEQLLPGSLFVGKPRVIRVPQDQPTIDAAILAAEPGSDIEVAQATYHESIVIDRPLRLIGLAGAYPRPTLSPDSSGTPVITILPEAGAMTEVAGFSLHGGNVYDTGGAGIRCLAPALIHHNVIWNCEANGAGARGGGIYAVAGTRIVANSIGGNRAYGPEGASPEDPWQEDPAVGGVGGGVFCLGCYLERNSIDSNSARLGGGVVMDGTLVGNLLEVNNDHLNAAEGACRGVILRNHFRSVCYGGCRVDAPAVVSYNAWSISPGDLCDVAELDLTGPVDFQHNTIAGYSIVACLANDESQLPPQKFVFRHNLLSSLEYNRSFAQILLNPTDDGCPARSGSSRLYAFPVDSVDVDCNFGPVMIDAPDDGRADRALFCSEPVCDFDNDGWECDGEFDLRLQANSPALDVCGEIAGAKGIGCGALPVSLFAQQVEARADGVHLAWQVSADIAYDGFHIERETAGVVTRISAEPLGACVECEYLDANPPEVGVLRYFAVPIVSGQPGERFFLGETSWPPSIARLSLSLPAPHPMREGSRVEFTAPPGKQITLDLFDVSGRRIGRLFEGKGDDPRRVVSWSGRTLEGTRPSAGIYFLRLSGAGRSVERKVLLLH